MLKVSICVPTYNSEAYLEESLMSIQNQTYKHIEVIISDNCSQDNTSSIIKKFAGANNWRYTVNKVNIGAGPNMNQLISLATGDLVAIYHSDDVYDPEIVAKSVSFFEHNPNCGMVSTLAKVIDSTGKNLGNRILPVSLKALNKNLYSFDEIFPAILDSFLPFIITPSVMVRKENYMQLGGFINDGRYKSATDYEMWLRILKEYPMAIIPEFLIKYRKHVNQGSQLEIRENYGLPDGLAVYEEYARGNESFERKFKRTYSWLIFLQVVKLNSERKFRESSQMIHLIQQNGTKKYKLISKIFNILNVCSLRLSITYLNNVKDTILKLKSVKC